MSLHEPATFLTDVLLAAIAAWLAWRLKRSTAPGNRAARWLSRTLAVTAVSAIVGGCYHGFAPNFSTVLAGAWWRLTLWVIDGLSAAMAVSLVYEVVAEPARRAGFTAIVFKFFAFAAVVIFYPKFVVAIADYGSTLLAWLIASIICRRAWRAAMLTALGLSALAAVVQQ